MTHSFFSACVSVSQAVNLVSVLQHFAASSQPCPKHSPMRGAVFLWTGVETWFLRGAGKATKYVCSYQNPGWGPLSGCTSRLGDAVGCLQHHQQLFFSGGVFLGRLPQLKFPQPWGGADSTQGFGTAQPSKALSFSFPSGHPGQASLWGDVDTCVVGWPRHDALRPLSAAHRCATTSATTSGEEGDVRVFPPSPFSAWITPQLLPLPGPNQILTPCTFS